MKNNLSKLFLILAVLGIYSSAMGAGVNTITQLQTYLLKVSSGDTTPNYLYNKLVAGSNITLTKNNAGANETITISAGAASGVTNSYASTTFPSFGYASSTFVTYPYATSTFSTYAYGTSTYLTYLYGSSTFPSFTYATNTFPTFTYASSTFVTYPYASTTFPSFNYASTSFMDLVSNQTAAGLKIFSATTTMTTALRVGTSSQSTAKVEINNQDPTRTDGGLRIISTATSGADYDIRIDSPNCDIEFVETDQVAPAGKYEIACQGDVFQLNGRSGADDTFENQFQMIRNNAVTTYEFGFVASTTSATMDAIRIRNSVSSAGAAPGISWYTDTNAFQTARLSSAQGASGAASFLKFEVASSTKGLVERMRIDVNGFLGVGVTAPTDRLQVAGNVTPSADITYGLGSSTLRWLNLFSSNVYASNTVSTMASSSAFFSSQATTTNLNFAHATGTNLALSGLFRDSINANGTVGQVLWATGTSTLWVATSTLNILTTLSGGTTGKVARWTSATALSSGLFLDNGTVTGINATTSGITFNLKGGSGQTPFQIASSTGTILGFMDTSGSFGIGTSTFLTGVNKEKMVIDTGTTTQNTPLGVKCNINDYCQITVTNASSSSLLAEAGLTLQNSSSTPVSNFMYIGKNGPMYATTSTYGAGYRNDGTIFNDANSLQIVNTGIGTNVMNFLTGGTSTTTNTRLSIDGNGALRIATTTTPIYGFTVATTTQFTAGIISRVFGYTSSSTITVDISRTDVATTTINQTTTFANPIGTAYDGQMFEIIGLATTTQTVSFGTLYASSTDLNNISSVASGTTRWLFEYNGYRTRWDLVGLLKTYQ